MTLKKTLTIISIVVGLLTGSYYVVKIYKVLNPTITTTTTPTTPPVSHKEVNTISWTHEVVIGKK
jgi:hypothetical protein